MRSLTFLLLTAFFGLIFTTPSEAQRSHSMRSHSMRSHSYTKKHVSSGRARSVHVKGYTRHTKTGKTVHVHAYNRSKARHH